MNILIWIIGYLFGKSAKDDKRKTPYHHNFHKHMTKHKNKEEDN